MCRFHNIVRVLFSLLCFGAAACGSDAVAQEAGPVSLELPVSFELKVQPIMAARGCSTGACHGKQRGQNGFQLSLLGFDPEFDYAALTMNARGRRIFPAAPDQSLLLLKATGQVPHGGGQRFAVDSEEYQTLAADAPYYFGSTLKSVAVPEKAKPYTPATPEEVLALQTVDWSKIVPVRAQLVERFDRTFAT